MSTQSVTLWLLGAGLFPLWLAAGLADWWMHRRSTIETTSGLAESITHLMLASCAGTGVLILLTLEINLAILAALAVLFVLHEIVFHLDLHTAAPVREISIAEQQIHVFLTAVPFATLVAVVIVVFSSGQTDFVLSLKAAPLDLRTVAAMLAAMTLFGAIPYWEEFFRCFKSARTAQPIQSAIAQLRG